MALAIKAENLSKAYQLGEFSTGTISRDIERLWYKVRGKEDPFLKIGETNDRTTKGNSDVVWSLKDINFEIEQGDAVGIIGRNGAGKSTLLKVLSRVTTPTSGGVKVKGRIASLLEVGTGFHPELTGRENIYLNGAILGMRKQEIKRKFDEIVDFAGVERYIDTPVKRYSSGMYVRLAFAVAAHLESEILIVDEVLAVGDAEFQKKCLGKMNDVSKGEGRTVLFVSHNMASIRNLCQKALVLQHGSVLFDGSIDQGVETYLAFKRRAANQLFCYINNSHRKFTHSRDVEIVSVELLNTIKGNMIASEDPISFKIQLKGNKTLSNIRISGSVLSREEARLGSFFGDEIICITKGEQKTVCISLLNHNLAKGEYAMNFSVGKGNEVIGNIDYDIVYEVLSFEVAYKKGLSTPILKWMSNWGNCSFKSTTVVE